MSSEAFNRPFGLPTGPLSRGTTFYTGDPKRMPSMCLNMRTSAAGKRFIFDVEVGPFKSRTAHLHWPEGKSGVTLGPGYDMKERSAVSVIADLRAIGVSQADAALAATGVGLVSTSAGDFAAKHLQLINLTDEHQLALLGLIVPAYERIVNRHVQIQLKTHEFDALVCFVYNPGDSFIPVAQKVNLDDMEAAASIMRLRVPKKGPTRDGLINRRSRETALMLQGMY